MTKSTIKLKKLWLVTTPIFNFTILAKTEKDCKELIDELTEDSISGEKLIYQQIGNGCPTLPFYNEWTGESFIISTNFYNI